MNGENPSIRGCAGESEASSAVAGGASDTARFFRSKMQAVIGWVGAVLLVGGVVATEWLSPRFRTDQGYIVAAVALLVAAVCIRFARCGVHASPAGVRVTNMLSPTDLTWDEIREFKLSPVGACLIGLTDGRWVSITGIEQTNLAWMTNRRDTPERRMIADLNDWLRKYGESAPRRGALPSPRDPATVRRSRSARSDRRD